MILEIVLVAEIGASCEYNVRESANKKDAEKDGLVLLRQTNFEEKRQRYPQYDQVRWDVEYGVGNEMVCRSRTLFYSS
jgi:hypothetical protein